MKEVSLAILRDPRLTAESLNLIDQVRCAPIFAAMSLCSLLLFEMMMLCLAWELLADRVGSRPFSMRALLSRMAVKGWLWRYCRIR